MGYNTALPKAGDASTALLFLAGRATSPPFFRRAAARSPEGEWHLRLTPNAKQPDYQTMTLVVDWKTLALRGLTLKTEDGTQTFTFTRFRPTPASRTVTSTLKFPNGTDVRCQ